MIQEPSNNASESNLTYKPTSREAQDFLKNCA